MPDSAQLARLPVRVPLVNEVWGIWKSLSMARTNVLGIIPDIATTQPIVSGKTGKRWHMVMDPGAIRGILLDKLDQYPKSVVTKNLLRPAIGESLFVAVAMALAKTYCGPRVFASQRVEPCPYHDSGS